MSKSRILASLSCALVALALGASHARAQVGVRSWVITGAQIADGTGKPLRKANVRVQGDKIIKIGDFKPR